MVGPASANEAVPFGASASADGVRVTVSAPGFLVVEDFVDGGGPSAGAVLDSLGTSEAFASLPYPGETAVAFPGLVSVLTQQSVPFAYPFYVRASNPTAPKGEMYQPGMELRAAAEPAEAGGFAGGGSDGAVCRSVAAATASHRADAGLVVSAETSMDLVELGPVTLHGFRSVARLIERTGGQPVREASAGLGGLTVNGQAVAPPGIGSGQSPVVEVGAIRIEMGAPVETADGVSVPGLQVSLRQAMPGVGRDLVVTYVIGRVSVSGQLG